VIRGLVGALLIAGCAAGCGEPTPAAPSATPSAAPPATPSATPSATVPSTGPGLPAPAGQLTLDVGGVSRTYLLHFPAGDTGGRSLPLVIALHFYPGTGSALREMIGMDAKADRHKFLVAYPDGLDGGFNALVCCGATADVAFLRALTQHLVSTGRADPDRVYLTGISNGADMSFRAAVEASGLFAAIGVVSGGYIGPLTKPASYVPRKPVSVVTVIGSDDRYFTDFRTGIATWQQRLRCKQATAAPPAPTVTRTRARCADRSDVEVYVVKGMGHAWPGARSGQLAEPRAPIVATDILWDFFAAHPRLR
jgi:polyhydroxybutyrate depolymerase